MQSGSRNAYEKEESIQTYDTCIQANPELDLKSQDLAPTAFHNSDVTALPIPWEQGGGELGICIQVFFMPIWL